MKNKKAILWDNDGVLVDTEKLYFKATRNILAQSGFDFTKEMFIQTILVESSGPWHHVKSNGISDHEIIRLKSERNLLYEEYLATHHLLISGVKQTVSRLSKKYEMCIVTSSHKKHFDTIHSRTSLLQYFKFVLTREDYKNAKPNPEPYMRASELIGYPPEQCIAVEDSRRGLIASTGASIDCIIVPNTFTRNSDFREAIVILNKVQEIEGLLL